jgi:hypothetical protein
MLEPGLDGAGERDFILIKRRAMAVAPVGAFGVDVGPFRAGAMRMTPEERDQADERRYVDDKKEERGDHIVSQNSLSSVFI